MKRSSRTPSNLSESLHRQLNSYALAASAAGVSVRALTPPVGYLLATGAALAGVFALTEPAEARIVYTRTRKNVVCHGGGPCNGALNLNLNHGKSADFRVSCSSAAGFWKGLTVVPVNNNNRVWTSPGYPGRFVAAALYKGAIIQSASNFRTDRQLSMFWSSECSTGQHGPWVNVKNRYLGLKFLIKGKVHYGWARLSTPQQWDHNESWATLTGYAYETIPGRPIIAGKTHGRDVITVQSASLGHLARGASELRAWREKEQ